MAGFKTEQGAFDFLQQMLDDVEALKGIISDQPLSIEKRNTARERLIDLKDRLQQYVNKSKTASNQKKMTKAETAFVYPAMQKAFVELKTKIGSYPNANWNDALSGVAVILRNYLPQKKAE
jgi:hypothetical protein